MPKLTDVKSVRKRAAHYLSEEVANRAGMHLPQLQQFVAGTFHPSAEQIHALAVRFGLYQPEGSKR